MATNSKRLNASVERHNAAHDLLTEVLLGGTAEGLKRVSTRVTLTRGPTSAVLQGTVNGASFAVSKSGLREFAPGFPDEAKEVLIEFLDCSMPIGANKRPAGRPGLQAP